MAKSKVDAKEFMLQYGDRIGVGIAGFLAVLFIVFAMMGTSGGVSAEQVKESGKKADDAIRRSEVNPDKIAIKDEPSIKTLAQIEELSRALAKPFTIDQLMLTYRYFLPEELRGIFRSNPKVLEIKEMAIEPVVGAFRIYETRYVNNQQEVMVLQLRAGVTAPKLGGNQGGNNFKPGQGGLGGGGLGGRGGVGGMGGAGLGSGGLGGTGGVGGIGGAGGPGGLGGIGGAGLGGGGPGGQRGNNPPTKPEQNRIGGDDSMYTIEWRKDKDVKENDTLGVTILPLRTAYIVATYPHREQSAEIAKKLQIDIQAVSPLYRKIEVQRRRVFLQGSHLPDGRHAETDLIEIDNPRDRTKKEYKTVADADKAVASADDQTSEKDRNSLGGWSDVNMQNVASIMRSAYSVARFSNDPFHAEKEPLVESLMEYAGPRIAMRLPQLVRSEYPDIMNKLPLFMGNIKKLKEDEKAKIPPPPKDSRLGTGGSDEFDDGKEAAGDNKKGSDTPVATGDIPEYVPIRFVDVDLNTELVGSATFEYRVRMVLFNPNYKKENEVAAPEFAKEEFLTGNWSAPSRVTFEPDVNIYAGERDRPKGSTEDPRDRDKVPVQLHKWLGKINHLDGSSSIVGDWWVEKLLIGRGEYISRSPDLPGPAGESNMAYWVSHAFDTVNSRIGADVQKKTRTLNLMTESILVDFQGGAYNSFRSDFNRSTKKDDLPGELLVLEPDGRIIARHLLEDRNDTSRKTRLDKWTAWLEKLAKPEKKPAAAGGGGNPPLGGKGNAK